MPSYMAFCEDGPNGSALREEHMAAHLSHVETVLDQIQVAGPMREDDGAMVSSSCFIFKADTLADAQALLAADPYHVAGIYRSVRWFDFVPAAGVWVGGKSWT
ncbi:MAG: YciI family protein [Congregibacter sp.]